MNDADGVLTAEIVVTFAKRRGFEIADRLELPSREPRYLPVPSQLHPAVRDLLTSKYPSGLYSHQAEAIEVAVAGNDVCLATSTASGKSLVFVTVAADLLRRQPEAKVLALYPARALIQDQVEKWQAILKPLNIPLGCIDGSVSPDLRDGIVRASRVVLMTPDVAHAWLMSHLAQPEVAGFMGALRLLILDEAHVYDGVFGTNMAFFLRRFQAASGTIQMISSTATLGDPAAFIEQLSGRKPRSFGLDEDGSGTPPKSVLLARVASADGFGATAALLSELALMRKARFLAFTDSRITVERIVAASHRGATKDGDATQDDLDDSDADEGRAVGRHRVLPYRAGYETEDRSEIQNALEAGALAGVVSTSAMELGIDIGEIDLVVLLNVPPTTKAFWQRVGRTGRHRAGTCLLIDARGVLAETAGRLVDYVSRPLEPNWLYLENRYLQYANALCAAVELRQQDGRPLNTAPFDSLPASFQHFLANELSPADAIPPDLHALRQRAANPHHAFPLRSGIEQGFQVRGPHGRLLGSVTLSQALREAYPGAIYYYMAHSYRAYRWNAHNGEILARREHHWTTRPIAQAMVFPRFQGGTISLMRAGGSFVVEVETQVRERVLGFVEQRGAVTEEHRYGPTSPFHDRELTRFFETTGVCWYFAEPVVMSDAVALAILEAYCANFGVQPRDLGVGRFHSKTSPMGDEKCQGLCIFDATHGSLRLTQRLAERFADVVEAAIAAATRDDALNVAGELAGVAAASHNLRPVIVDGSAASSPADGDRIEVIAPGERAMFRGQSDVHEVQVMGYRHTPHRLMYELASQPGVKWTVAANQVEPLYGETAMVRVNLTTEEARPAP